MSKMYAVSIRDLIFGPNQISGIERQRRIFHNAGCIVQVKHGPMDVVPGLDPCLRNVEWFTFN